MISREQIESIIDPFLLEGFFLIDIKISKENKVKVFIDKLDGITIQQCADISRKIEKSLDREKEDFELEVTSPGLSEPFKVRQQYEKNKGRDIQVQTNSNEKFTGKLLSVEPDSIEMEIVIDKKKKLSETKKLFFNNIKTGKVLISFK